MRRMTGWTRLGLLLTAACVAQGCKGDEVAGSASASDGAGSSGSVQTTSGAPTSEGATETVSTGAPTSGMTEAMTSSAPTSSSSGVWTGEFTTGPDPTDTEGSTDTDSESDTDPDGPRCGNGVVDVGEGCDDGEANGPGKACNGVCAPNVCGDGDQGPQEDCDDGANNADSNSCKTDCTNNICGDGRVGPGEGCDDGNQNDDDECGNNSSFPATAPTRQLTSKLHGRNRWVFPRLATGPPSASPRPCPPGLEKSWRRELAWMPGDSGLAGPRCRSARQRRALNRPRLPLVATPKGCSGGRFLAAPASAWTLRGAGGQTFPLPTPSTTGGPWCSTTTVNSRPPSRRFTPRLRRFRTRPRGRAGGGPRGHAEHARAP